MDLIKSTNLAEKLQADRRRERRFIIILCCVFGGLLAAFSGLLVYGVLLSQEDHARFMSQCMQDHKEYECTAMWRAGDQHPLPQVIFIPSGR